MRRSVYLLLVVFLVQLSGLRLLCVARHGQAHPCCPMPATTLPSSSPLPDCCVSCILNSQGSIAEARNTYCPSDNARLADCGLPFHFRLVVSDATFLRLNTFLLRVNRTGDLPTLICTLLL